MSPVAREHSFDELTRGMASGSISRGKALRLMGAALVGGTLGSLGMREAAADPPGCKRAGKACKKNSQCCSGNCVNAPTGTCAACPSGQVLCNNGSCVSNSCLANSGQVFNSSTCQCECPSGRVLLSNGTCATPCSTAAECSCSCIGRFPSITEGLCGTSSLGDPCATDASCPPGEFCRGLPGSDPLSGVCTPAC
jgi:hypothetical protein